MKRWLRQFHENQHGAIGVLMLLTVWCLVAVIAMLWNTAEYSKRRQQVQNAADAAAHDSALWMSRTLNVVAGQNMAICRDASAEAIWRAAISTGGDPNLTPPYPKSGSLYNELARELRDAQNGRDPIRGLQAQLNSAVTRVELDYELTTIDLQAISPAATDDLFSNAQSKKDFLTKVRQANSALNWVEKTYVEGTASSVPSRPGPPGPNGEGLLQLVHNWHISVDKEQAIFNLIISFIDGSEMPVVQSFQDKILPATSQPLPGILQAHEAKLFAEQQNERDSAPLAIDQQVHSSPVGRPASTNNVEDHYNAKITLATIKQQVDEPMVTDTPAVAGGSTGSTPLGLAGSGTASAPVITPMEVDATAGQGYVDTIRERYPEEAAAANLPITFDIDPISPHTIAHTSMDADGNQQQWEDATIWHPNVTIPWSLGTFTVQCNVPGGWGHIWLMPLERELDTRIANDQQDLRNDYMVTLDNLRWTSTDTGDLAHQIWAMQNLPLTPQIASLPASLIDDTQNNSGGYDSIQVLPSLQPPTHTTTDFTHLLTKYNADKGTYLSQVNQLRTLLLLYVSAYEEYYNPFAVNQWIGAVNTALDIVRGANVDVPGLLQQGTYMTLATYKLRPIPGWAKDSMHSTIQQDISDYIMYMNIPRLVGGNLSFANVLAARAALQGPAYQVAGEIADEWVNRPWPYEIAPPGTHTPTDHNTDTSPLAVPAGMTHDDRQHFFSILAVAVDNERVRPLMANIFGQAAPMIAYAQGEAFNWMNFNTGYGGNESFDNPSYTVNHLWAISDFKEIGCPRGWRLSTTGGWNWQPRLAISDTLSEAAQPQLNSDVRALLEKAGLSTDDDDSLSEINLH
jgi:hypothetical protein